MCIVPKINKIMILGWLLFFCLITGHSCLTTIGLEHSSCTFHLNSPSNISSFDLAYCQWEDCEGSNSDYCLRYPSKQSTSWWTCTMVCCSNTDYYPQTQEGLDQCQDSITSQYLKKIVLGIFIPFGALLFVVVCCFCKFGCRKCCQCIHHGCRRIGTGLCLILTCGCCKNQRVNIEQSKRQDSCIELDISPEPFEPLWISEIELNSQRQVTCSVCLEDKTTLSLDCGHSFHRQCIVECFKRKLECILCRSTKIAKARVFCEVCLCSYFETSVRQNLSVLNQKKQICQMCQKFNKNI